MKNHSTAAPSVTIGAKNGARQSNHITVTVLGRMHDTATDFWDGNWFVSPVDFKVGAFHGTVNAALRANELSSFREQLEEAYTNFGGIARLTSLEDWLDLTVEVSASGHVDIKGTLTDEPGVGNTLAFEIHDLDQTQLPAIIDSLKEIAAAFPVLGKP